MRNSLICMFCLMLFTGIAHAQTETEKSDREKAKDFEDKKDYEGALKWYKKASVLNPKNATTYYDMAWVQNELELYDDATVSASKGIAIAPSSKLYTECGYSYYKLKNYDLAILKYRKALDLKPDEASAVKGLADSYYSNKQYEEASTYYKKCIEINKDAKTANYKLAWISNDQKKYQKAVEYAQAAIKEDDQYASAYNELGYAYSQLEQKSAALENYKKAAELDLDDATYTFNVADIYYTEGAMQDYEQAITYYKKGLRLDPKNAVSNYRLGWILNDKERYDEAKPYLYKAVEIDPEYGTAWLELGWIDLSTKNYEAAESDLLKAIQYDKKSELGRYYLGQVYIGQGKSNNAQRMVDELNNLNSKYADKLKAKM